MVQNRVYVYNFLLIKIFLFNRWLSGLSREAKGSSGLQDHPLPGLTGCSVAWAFRAGLALIEFPVWLLLRGPRLAWAVLQGCARALGLAPLQPGALEPKGLSLATWTHMLLSGVQSLLLATVVLALLAWRLLQKAGDCGLGRLSYKVGKRDGREWRWGLCDESGLGKGGMGLTANKVGEAGRVAGGGYRAESRQSRARIGYLTGGWAGLGQVPVS